MGPDNENQNVINGNTAFFPALRESRLTPFVCKWRALQQERACQVARLDRFSKEISDKVADLCQMSWQIGQADSPLRKLLLRNFLAS
jgi:hypothetical protein